MGRPFDSEFRVGLANIVGTDYLFSAWARPGNLFSGIPLARRLIFTPNKIWKKQNTKTKTRAGELGMLFFIWKIRFFDIKK